MLNKVDSTATENRLMFVTVVVLGSGIFQLVCCAWHPDPVGVENPGMGCEISMMLSHAGRV
jgi:hypothetical protein